MTDEPPEDRPEDRSSRDDAEQVPDGPVPNPEFGPSGYLPGRAAKRARKIVLRAPLGVQWIVASIVAGAVVLIAGLVFLTAGDDPPGDPFVQVGPVEMVGDLTVLDDLDAVAVGAAGRIRVFADATALGLVYCEESRHLEGDDGRVWSLTGRGLGGADSLREHPAVVHSGILYVDPTRTVDGPAPSDEAAEPAC
ncbi:MAG: hypothetical protein R3343_14870 [Nitriliruptorales bacterium]|nr:hypothetical protein [Nitriliruptorales bacterium]